MVPLFVASERRDWLEPLKLEKTPNQEAAVPEGGSIDKTELPTDRTTQPQQSTALQQAQLLGPLGLSAPEAWVQVPALSRVVLNLHTLLSPRGGTAWPRPCFSACSPSSSACHRQTLPESTAEGDNF